MGRVVSLLKTRCAGILLSEEAVLTVLIFPCRDESSDTKEGALPSLVSSGIHL